MSVFARLGIATAWTVSFIVYRTPVRVGYFIADLIGFLLFARSRRYRRAVVENIRHVHAGRVDERRLRRQAVTVFRMSARNFWDLACLPRMSPDEVDRLMHAAKGDWTIFDQVMAKGKGAIAVTGHIGPFDFVGQHIAASPWKPLLLTASTVSSEFVFAAVTWARASAGGRIEVVSPATVRRCLKTLRGGGMIGIVTDRDVLGTGWPVRLFGKETTLPAGAVRLARDTGAPLIPMFGLRQDTTSRARRFVYYVEQPIYVPATADRNDDVARGLEQLVAVLERYIAMAPDQWVTFERIWPEPGAAPRRSVADGFRRVFRPGRDGLRGSGAPAAEPLAPAAAPETR